MSNGTVEVNNYINVLDIVEKEWMQYFVEYMRENHSDLEELISYSIPTYKLGSGKERNYIGFSCAKKHFALHTLDFEYLECLRGKLSKPGKGRGSVQVPYANVEEREILLDAIDEIVARRNLKR